MKPSPPETSSESNWKNLNPLHAARDLADASQALGKLRDSTDASDAPARNQNRRKFSRALGVISVETLFAVLAVIAAIYLPSYGQNRQARANQEIGSAEDAPAYTPTPDEERILEGFKERREDWQYDSALKNRKNLRFLGITFPSVKDFFKALFSSIEKRRGTNTMNTKDKTLALEIYNFFEQNGMPIIYDEHDQLVKQSLTDQQFSCAPLDENVMQNPGKVHHWFLAHGVPYFDRGSKTLFFNQPQDGKSGTDMPYVQFDYMLALRDAYYVTREGGWFPARDIPLLSMDMGAELFQGGFDDKKWQAADTQEAVLEVLVAAAKPMVGVAQNRSAAMEQKLMETMVWRVAHWCYMTKTPDLHSDPRTVFLLTYIQTPQNIVIPSVDPPKSEPTPQTIPPPFGYTDCKPEADMKTAMQTIITNLVGRGTIAEAQRGDAIPLARQGACWKLLAIEQNGKNRDLFLYDEPGWTAMLRGGQNTSPDTQLDPEAALLADLFIQKGRPAIYVEEATPPSATLQEEGAFAYMSLDEVLTEEDLIHQWYQNHDIPYANASKTTLYIRRPHILGYVKSDSTKLLGTLRQFQNWIALSDMRQIANGETVNLSDPIAAKILGDAESLIGITYTGEQWEKATTEQLIFRALEENAKIIVRTIFGESGGDSDARKTFTEAVMYTQARWILMRKIDLDDVRYGPLARFVQAPHVFSLGK